MQPNEEGIRQGLATPHNLCLRKTAFLHQAEHFAVAPLLEMEALQLVSEKSRHVVGAGEAVRAVKEVDSSRLEDPKDGFEVGNHIVGMEMLEELIAEGHVHAVVRDLEVIPVVDDELEILRLGILGVSLIGDIDSDDLLADFASGETEATVPGGHLEEYGFLAQKGAKEAHLGLDILSRRLLGVASGQPGVIRHTLEQFRVERLEELGSLFPGGVAHAASEFTLHFEVMTNAFWSSRIGRHGKRRCAMNCGRSEWAGKDR